MPIDWGVSRLDELLSPVPMSPADSHASPAQNVWSWDSDETDETIQDPPDYPDERYLSESPGGSITARLRAAEAEANQVMSSPEADAFEAKSALDAKLASIEQARQAELPSKHASAQIIDSPQPASASASPVQADDKRTRSRRGWARNLSSSQNESSSLRSTLRSPVPTLGLPDNLQAEQEKLRQYKRSREEAEKQMRETQEKQQLQALVNEMQHKYTESESKLYRLQVEQEMARHTAEEERKQLRESLQEEIANSVSEQVSLMETKLNDATGRISSLLDENKKLSFQIKKVETAQHVQIEGRSYSPAMNHKIQDPVSAPGTHSPDARSVASPEPSPSPLPTNCYSCGNKYADDAEFCRMCGKPRTVSPEPSPQDRDAFSQKLKWAKSLSKTKWGTLKTSVKLVSQMTKHTHTQGGYRLSPTPDNSKDRKFDANSPPKKKYIRIGGKIIEPTKVQAALEKAHKSAHRSADKVRAHKGIKSPDAKVDTEHGSFARIGGRAANASMAFGDAVELATTKNRMSKMTFYLPKNAPDPEDGTWNDCHSKLRLVHVHGFSGGAGMNILENSKGSLIYACAAVIVVSTKEKVSWFGNSAMKSNDSVFAVREMGGVGCSLRKQAFYRGHDNTVTAITMHPDGDTVASSQLGHKPPIHIWKSSTQETLIILRDGHKQGVLQLGFFGSGKWLLSLGIEPEGRLAHSWDWKKQLRLLQSDKIDPNQDMFTDTQSAGGYPILGLATHRDHEFAVSVGEKLVRLYYIDQDTGVLKPKVGTYGKFKTPKYCTSALIRNDGVFLVGTNLGRIYIFSGASALRLVKASIGQSPGLAWGSRDIFGHGITELPLGVMGMAESSTHNIVATVSSGGNLRIWDKDLNPIGDAIPVVDGEGYRAFCCSVSANAQGLTVGTTSGRLHMWDWSELDLNNDGQLSPEELASGIARRTKILAEGHAVGCRIAVHPSEPFFTSGSPDGTVHLWSLSEHRQLGNVCHLKEPVSCVEFRQHSPTISNTFGTVLVGTYHGAVYSFAVQGEKVNNVWLEELGCFWRAASGQEIVGLRESPCERWIVAVTNAGGVNVFDGKEPGLNLLWRGEHSSRVLSVDFSNDGDGCQTSDHCGEVIMWDMLGKKQATLLDWREEEFHTWSSLRGWQVAGIWPKASSGHHVRTCDRIKTHQKSILVTGDRKGIIKLFNYPVVKWASKYKAHRGHTYVESVRFSGDDSHVVLNLTDFPQLRLIYPNYPASVHLRTQCFKFTPL